MTEPNFNIFLCGISKVAAATIIVDLKSLTMNYYLAVFNCHIKDAEQAACEKFIFIWGEKKFNSIVERLQKNGLMSIIIRSQTLIAPAIKYDHFQNA